MGKIVKSRKFVLKVRARITEIAFMAETPIPVKPCSKSILVIALKTQSVNTAKLWIPVKLIPATQANAFLLQIIQHTNATANQLTPDSIAK